MKYNLYSNALCLMVCAGLNCAANAQGTLVNTPEKIHNVEQSLMGFHLNGSIQDNLVANENSVLVIPINNEASYQGHNKINFQSHYSVQSDHEAVLAVLDGDEIIITIGEVADDIAVNISIVDMRKLQQQSLNIILNVSNEMTFAMPNYAVYVGEAGDLALRQDNDQYLEYTEQSNIALLSASARGGVKKTGRALKQNSQLLSADFDQGNTNSGALFFQNSNLGWGVDGNGIKSAPLLVKVDKRMIIGANAFIASSSEESANTGSEASVNNGSEASANPGSEESANPGSEESANTGSEESANTGSEESANTGSEESANPSPEESVNTGSEESVNTGSEGSVNTGSEGSANTGSEESANTGSKESVNTGSEQSTNDGFEEPNDPEDPLAQYITPAEQIKYNLPLLEDEVTPTQVSEPSTLAIFALAVGGVLYRRKKVKA
ncbi:PEP-CTERM sorting domain-containing protein [Colwelliaceae bacterium 6441]